jgi:alpha-L-arabinofuranosidase
MLFGTALTLATLATTAFAAPAPQVSLRAIPSPPLSSRADTLKLSLDLFSTKTGNFRPAVFIEDSINYGTDGGLYAELIRNRGFFNSTLDHWSAISSDLKVTTQTPLSDAIPRSVAITAQGDDAFGIQNEGYFGMTGESGTYEVSFYARADDDKDTTATVALTSTDGSKKLASGKVDLALTSEWQEFTTTITNSQPASGGDNVFKITFPSEASKVYLTVASVFPETYGKTTGRKDLAQALADLKSSYFRLPGGNELEGNGE